MTAKPVDDTQSDSSTVVTPEEEEVVATKRDQSDKCSKEDSPLKEADADDEESPREKELTKEPELDTNAKHQKPKLPQSEVFFAFGPGQNFFIRCRSAWRMIFKTQGFNKWEELQTEFPVFAAFKHNTGFFLGGERGNGSPQVVMAEEVEQTIQTSEADNWIKTRDANKALFSWLTSHYDRETNDARDVSVTIGPNGSYFARCGTFWKTHQLPNDLTERLKIEEEKGKVPAHIALGVDSTWVVLWDDGTRNWDIKSKYEVLRKAHKLESEDGNVVFVALNPFQEHDYFLVTKDGSCTYQLHVGDKFDKLKDMFDAYMQMRAKRDNSTFEFQSTVGGVSKGYKIDATTNYGSKDESKKETKTARSTSHGGNNGSNGDDTKVVGSVDGKDQCFSWSCFCCGWRLFKLSGMKKHRR